MNDPAESGTFVSIHFLHKFQMFSEILSDIVDLYETLHPHTKEISMENHEYDVNDLGLAADLEMLKRSPINRRRILKMGAVGIGLLLAGERSLATLSSAAPAQQAVEPAAYLPLIMGPGATATPTATATTSATATPTTNATATPTSTTACVTEIPQET